jgi:outer membrane receptor protein involved in Fe transport
MSGRLLPFPHLLLCSLTVFATPLWAQTEISPIAPNPDQPAAIEEKADGNTVPTARVEEDKPEKEVAVIIERSTNLVGKADSASQGTVGAEQLSQRPVLRPGELIETVPGAIITQHSGSGKANQYFLRGFNLDHGTDLALNLDGMPINMRTHGHGQGYADLNFLIPELIQGITYRKGSYNADQGDFSSAGSVDISYARRLQQQTVEPGIGTFGFKRFLAVGTPDETSRNWVYGLEYFNYDGPWRLPEDYRRLNGVLRYSRGDERRGFSITGMGYDGKWNSTDQVPQRAINSGLIDRFGNIDPTDGGKTQRYSLSANWRNQGARSRSEAAAYGIDYKLNLWSNFTYFLDDPVRGDQFEQADDRTLYGFAASHTLQSTLGRREVENTFGLQGRHDNIGNVGLYLTQGRNRFATVRQDNVKESSIAPYFENRIRWSPTFRTTAGVRYDTYRFNVNSSIPVNSGKVSDSIISPKLSMAFGPFNNTEFYLNAAQSFHSNDARGTTIRIDPKTGAPASRVTPLVRANMGEIGVRSTAIKNLQSTLALWALKFDSELLFVGDAGTTEASRPSRRVGIEWTNYYTPKPWLTFEFDYAFARARFSDNDPAGNRIPGAIEGVVSAGASVDHPSGWFGGVRLRYFGPRPLIEDNSVRSSSSTLLNGRVGRKVGSRSRVSLDVFNLLNSKVSDIDYYYTSRLPGEPAAGVDDIHTHPAESRSLRLSFGTNF